MSNGIEEMQDEIAAGGGSTIASDLIDHTVTLTAGNVNPFDVVRQGIVPKECEKDIQQVGVDLRVTKVERNCTRGLLDPVPLIADLCMLRNGYAYQLTLCEVAMPEDCYGYIAGRSRFNRSGVLIRSSIIDPGYHGVVGVTAYCFADMALEKNERVGQLLVFYANAASTYEGSHQKEGLE